MPPTTLVLITSRPDGAVRYTRYAGRQRTHAVEALGDYPLTRGEVLAFAGIPDAFLARYAA